MLFNSLTFAFFFAAVLLAHRLAAGWNTQKNILLVASYIFYGSWNPPFALLLAFSSTLDWWLGRALGRAEDPVRRKALLILSLASNLSLLGYFKYGEFLLSSFSDSVALLGVHYAPPDLGIVLPVGISFYTFQSMSYTIDVYRREIKSTWSFRDFALFVSFFPQLVAGPIVRAREFLPQLEVQRRASSDQLGWGLCLLLIGLFWKVVLADTVFAPVVDQVYLDPSRASAIDAWAAVFGFSGQIFYDFAGYSLCAIGAALCFGFALPDNFRYPYAALGFSDFWRRWHISLSTWLRDYLYVSLGGNRQGAWLTYRNLMLTMLIGGLWHGASWLFVLWGGLHGFYLAMERFIRGRLDPSEAVPAKSAWVTILGMIATFLVVSLTWIPFRATDGANAMALTGALFGTSRGSVLEIEALALCLLAMVATVATQIAARNSSPEATFAALRPAARVTGLTLMLLAIYFCSGGDDRAFIYFQF